MSAMELGTRLVDLCRAGKNRQAIEELYSDDHVAREAAQMPGMDGREIKGKAAVLRSNDEFFASTEIHGGSVDGPYPHDDSFIVFMSIDCTPKAGPMKGQRMDMKEACHYQVKNGKITRSTFYYPM